MSSKKKKTSLGDLSKFIVWLDSYAALAPADPQKIERLAKNSDDPDVNNAWRQVRDDVSKIANLAGSSENIRKLGRASELLKLVFTVMGFVAIIVFFALSSITIPFLSTPLATQTFFFIIVLVYMGAFIAFVYTNRRLTSRVREFYSKHAGEVAAQRKHVKKITSELMDRFVTRVRGGNLDPEKHKLTLYHKDYTGVVVVREERPKGNSPAAYVLEVRTSKPKMES